MIELHHPIPNSALIVLFLIALFLGILTIVSRTPYLRGLVEGIATKLLLGVLAAIVLAVLFVYISPDTNGEHQSTTPEERARRKEVGEPSMPSPSAEVQKSKPGDW